MKFFLILASFVSFILIQNVIANSPELVIPDEIIETLKNSTANFTHYEFAKSRSVPNDSYSDVEFDIQDVDLVWDVDEPVKAKDLGRSVVQLDIPVTMSYFYLNGTFRGMAPNVTVIHAGETLSYLDGNLTVNVRAIYNARTKIILFDSNTKEQKLNFKHHITWTYPCTPATKVECDGVISYTLDQFLPEKLLLNLEKRVHDVLYQERYNISKRIVL